MRRVLRILVGVLALGLVFGIGFAWPIIVRPPLVVGQDAVSGGATAKVRVSIEDAGGRTIVARPPSGVKEADTLVIIYPGGLVRPQAYEWLARREAVQGRVAVIPEFSFDLAVLDAGRADSLISAYGQGRKVVLIGHSLGGAMAAQYVSDRAKQNSYPVAGLVLLAAYPPDGVDLSTAKLKALSLRAQNDGVAAADKVIVGAKRLPSGAGPLVIDGAVHSFFGRYGPQSGDGVPTVSRSVAETQIAADIDSFIASL